MTLEKPDIERLIKVEDFRPVSEQRGAKLFCYLRRGNEKLYAGEWDPAYEDLYKEVHANPPHDDQPAGYSPPKAEEPWPRASDLAVIAIIIGIPGAVLACWTLANIKPIASEIEVITQNPGAWWESLFKSEQEAVKEEPMDLD